MSPAEYVREGAPLKCKDCGGELLRRIGTPGRQMERCDVCAGKFTRAYQRDYGTARRKRARDAAWQAKGEIRAFEVAGEWGPPCYPPAVDPQPEDCQGCGKPRNNAEGGLCAECSAR